MLYCHGSVLMTREKKLNKKKNRLTTNYIFFRIFSRYLGMIIMFSNFFQFKIRTFCHKYKM